jgi:hypothetical protein
LIALDSLAKAGETEKARLLPRSMHCHCIRYDGHRGRTRSQKVLHCDLTLTPVSTDAVGKVVVSPNIATQATIEFLSEVRAIYKGSDLGSSAVIFNVQSSDLAYVFSPTKRDPSLVSFSMSTTERPVRSANLRKCDMVASSISLPTWGRAVRPPSHRSYKGRRRRVKEARRIASVTAACASSVRSIVGMAGARPAQQLVEIVVEPQSAPFGSVIISAP